jgi:hypothetical protein
MALTRTEMKQMISKIDDVELQLLKLKAMLVPKSKATKAEIKAIEQGKKEMAKGESISSREFLKKLG